MLFHLYETSNSIWDFGKSSEYLSYFNKISFLFSGMILPLRVYKQEE